MTRSGHLLRVVTALAALAASCADVEPAPISRPASRRAPGAVPGLAVPTATPSILPLPLVSASATEGVAPGTTVPVSPGTGTPVPATPAPGTPVPGAATVKPSAGADLVSRVDASAPPAAVATLAPVIKPTIGPTPLGQAGFEVLVPGTPKGLAFLANTTTPWLIRAADLVSLDGAGQVRLPFSAGLSQPSAVAADGVATLWVVGAGKLHRLASRFEGLVSEATISVAPDVRELAVDSSEVWLAHGAGNVTRISKANNATASFAVAAPVALAIDATYAWIAGLPDKLYKMQRTTGMIVSTLTVGADPVAVAVDGASTVWVASKTSKSLSRLSAGASSPTSIPLGGTPTDLATDVSRLWVSQAGPQQLSYFGLDGSALGSVPLGFLPHAVAIDALGRVWLLNTVTGTVSHVWGR